MSDTERMAAALERIVGILELHYGIGGSAINVSAGSGPPLTTTSTVQPPVSVCPIHGTPWRTSKKDGTPSKRGYCSGKMDDGSYCAQQGPWL